MIDNRMVLENIGQGIMLKLIMTLSIRNQIETINLGGLFCKWFLDSQDDNVSQVLGSELEDPYKKPAKKRQKKTDAKDCSQEQDDDLGNTNGGKKVSHKF